MKKTFITKSEDYSTFEKQISAPLFRKVFSLNGFKSCQIEIAGLGFYELYVNGVNVTKGKLAPYISNPDDVIYYDKYDITDNVKSGENCIAVILGNGFINSVAGQFWDFDKASFRSSPKLALSLYADGKEILSADETFKCIDTPILFDDLRAGEWYDARISIKDAILTGYDDSDFDNAVYTNSPKGELRLCTVHPIKEERYISPLSVTKCKKGYIYDFGEINSGVCRLKVSGEKGQKITLRHGEMLIDGELNIDNISFANATRKDFHQCDVYICSGEVEETYEPRFTYHGFRYVLVEGITDAQATKDLLTFKVIHSGFTDSGKFGCNDKIVNKLQEITLRSDVSNFYYFPTDCPQREKNGWTADAALSSEQMLLNFDCSEDLREWLFNVRKAQKPTGELPGIVPTSGWGFAWGNGPAWDAVIVEMPYQLYRYTGNKEIISENADAIRKYLQYMQGHIKENGLIAYGLGDWCQSGQPHEWIYTTPEEVTDSITGIKICTQAKYMFSETGNEKDAEFADTLCRGLRKAFREKYIDDQLFISCRTQTAQAMALYCGIFEEGEKKKAFDNLLELIEKSNEHFDCGVLGAKVLFHILAEYGYIDLAYKLITQESYPSYGYLLKRGATTLWEHFTEFKEESDDYLRKDGNPVVSLNHHFYGDISALFYKKMAGINIERGKEITLCPYPVKNISVVNAEYKNRCGKIKVNIERRVDKTYVKYESEGFDVTFKCPLEYKSEKINENEYVVYIGK